MYEINFLSEKNLRLHKSYLEKCECIYSVLEKSVPKIKDKSISEILRLGIPREDKKEAVLKKSEILAHRIYFSSFSKPYETSDAIKREYGSEGSFIYEAYRIAKGSDGFLLVYTEMGRPYIYCGKDYYRVFLSREVILAVDLCEHAYFLDYGFEKDEYLRSALSGIALSKIH